jgi:hypothetical protein
MKQLRNYNERQTLHLSRYRQKGSPSNNMLRKPIYDTIEIQKAKRVISADRE